MLSRSSLIVRGTMSDPMRIDATASARSQPVSAMTTAATITATEPSASFTTSRNAARRLRLLLRAPASTAIDAMFPSRPTTPNTTISPVVTSGGSNSRRIPSTRMNPPTARSTAACPAAASTSARRYPQVRWSVGARRDRVAANQASDSPATSLSMCPASAKSARLPDRIAPTTSATRTTDVIASTTASRPRWSGGACECPPCPSSTAPISATS